MWYTKYLEAYNRPFDQIRPSLFEQIKHQINKLQDNNPLVTVSVIAYNEEEHLAACLWSLSEQKCKYPLEIIGVDNDSKDKTSLIFEKCGITSLKENRHSCGWARQRGLYQARGKFHINIDSDTMYPPHYVEMMVEKLMEPNTVAVSSLWSYIPDESHSALGLKIFEFCRDFHIWLQHFKRPELSIRGLVFAYRTDLAQKIGIRTDIIRGEDGYLAFKLKEHGKIRFLRDRRARAITGYGTVGNDGGLWQSFWFRVKKYLLNIGSIFTGKSQYEDQEDNLIRNK